MIKYVEYGEPKRSATGKTHIWPVESSEEMPLGEIRWYGAWRRYAVFPLSGTVFEQDCLRDLADFCERESTKARRRWQKQRKIR